jgi:HEAT repeat protein
VPKNDQSPFELVDDKPPSVNAAVDDEPPRPPPPRGPRLRTNGHANHRHEAHNSAPPRSRSRFGPALGVLSLAVGMAQFLLCAFPGNVGPLILAAATVGCILGAIGLVISLARKSNTAFPVGGLVVNVVATGVVLIWTTVRPFTPGKSPDEPAVAEVAATEVPHPVAPSSAPPRLSPKEHATPAVNLPTTAETVARCREALKSKVASERRDAAIRLRELGTAAAAAVPELAACVRDPDSGTRAVAIDALASFGRRSSAAYVDVVRASTDDDDDVRLAADHFLAGFGPAPAGAIGGLVTLSSEEKSPALQSRALNLLAQSEVASPAVMGAFAASLKSRTDSVRLQAARYLGQSGKARDPAVLPALLVALDDPSRRVRDAAGEAIDRGGALDPADVPRLREALSGGSDRTRVFVLERLTRLGPGSREALTDVLEALRDRETSVRLAAMECLLAIAPDRYGDVATLLGDRDAEVRKGALAALRRSKLTPAKYFEVLTDALSSTNEAARKDVAIALDQMPLPPIGDVPIRTRERLRGAVSDTHANPVVRVKAAKLLQALGWAMDPEARVLAELVCEPGDGIARDAAETLDKMGESATRLAADSLVRALGSKDAATRRAAAKALRTAGPLKPDAMSFLIGALSDGAIRENVAPLFADFGESVVSDLLVALNSPDTETRRGAARALGQVGPKAADAYKALSQHFRSDSDATVRQEASTALDLIRRKP